MGQEKHSSGTYPSLRPMLAVKRDVLANENGPALLNFLLSTLQKQQEQQPASQDSSVLHKVQKYTCTKEVAPVPQSTPSAQLIFKYGKHAQPAAMMGCGYWRSLAPSLSHSLALNILLCCSLPLPLRLQTGALPFNTVGYFLGAIMVQLSS